MVAKESVDILLVDDQPARLMTYEAILGPLGHRLVTASSGVEALKRLMDGEFAVILLDVSMPGMDGFETARLIHEHPRFEGTPIIFVTGVHVSELDRLKGYKLGAVDYVHVPVVPEILRSKVAVLVELHCQRLELKRLNESLSQTNAELDAANRELQREKARELAKLNRSLEEANRELAASNETLEEGDRRAAARGAGAAGCGPAQGRFPGDPGARAPQSARAHPVRHRDPAAPRIGRSDAGQDARGDRPPGAAHDAADRRPARGVAHHPGKDQPEAGAESTSARSSGRRLRPPCRRSPRAVTASS